MFTHWQTLQADVAEVIWMKFPAVGLCVLSQWGEIHIVDSLALSQCCRVSYPPFSGPPWPPRPHSLTHTACVQTTDIERYKGPGLVSSAVNTGVLLTALHKNPTIHSFLTNRSLHRSHIKPYFKTNSGVTLMREIVSVCLSGLNSQTLWAFFKQTRIS